MIKYLRLIAAVLANQAASCGPEPDDYKDALRKIGRTR